MDERDRAAVMPKAPYDAWLEAGERIVWDSEESERRAMPWFGTRMPDMPEWFDGATLWEGIRDHDRKRILNNVWCRVRSSAFGFNEVVRRFAVKTNRELCWLCNGDGKHVNPSIDSNGITGAEMHELGDDFRRSYMSGVYDVTCNECHGRRWVLDMDPDRSDPESVEAWYSFFEAEDAHHRECEAERRAGC